MGTADFLVGGQPNIDADGIVLQVRHSSWEKPEGRFAVIVGLVNMLLQVAAILWVGSFIIGMIVGFYRRE